jgi:hypothetical protein
MSDLIFQFFSQNPNLTLITTVNQYGIGAAESIPSRYLSTAGDYLIRVRGLQDLNQFYQLDLAVSGRPVAGTSADLNLDGETTLNDWSIFVANAYTNLSGLSNLAAFQHGDLDGDGDNDYMDFQFFKSAFDSINGTGAFASMTEVPEPKTLLLVGLGAIRVCAGRLRKRTPLAC